MPTPSRTLAGLCLAVGFCFVTVLAGCGGTGVPKPRVVKYAYDPLNSLKLYLEGFVNGATVQLEQEWLLKFVEEIRKTDADKAAVIESGLNGILKSPATARAEAKKLLDRL